MNESGHRRKVSVLGVTIAFVIPVAVAGLMAILLTRAGPHQVRLIGVPSYALQSLEVAPASEAEISEEQAIEMAISNTRGTSDGRVLDTALGRYREQPDYVYSGRLVWVVSLMPDKSAPVFLSGGVERDRSCDWAVHYDYVIAAVDAKTGELLWSGSGASFDLSLPPTYESPTNSSRDYCEQLFAMR